MELMEATVMEEVPVGFKRTEVGVIPNDWKVTELSYVTEKIGSGITPTGGSQVYQTQGRPFLRSQNVGWGRLILDDIVFIDEATHQTFPSSEIEDGDVFLNITGASIGRSAIADARVVGGNVNQHVCIIRPDAKALDAGFLCYYLNSQPGQRKIDSFQAGGNRQGLNYGQIGTFPIPLPVPEEQRLIDTALSDADGLLLGLEALLAKKQAIKQGALQALLTPPGQPGHRRLPGFTGEWGVKSFGELFNFGGGYSASRAQLSHKGHSYLHYGDIHMASSTVMDVQAEYHRIPKLEVPLSEVPAVSLLNEGDVVFVDASEDSDGVSKHVVVSNPDGVPFISGLHTIVAKPKPGLLVKSYSAYCFQSEDLKRQFRFYAVGTKVSGISKSNIPKLTIPLPSLQEQAAIGEILSDMDAELRVLEGRLAKLRAVKQGMMQELLTGRKRLV